MNDAVQLMDRPAEDAAHFRPMLFAVFGTDNAGRPFLGWGMQLGENEAVYCQPGSATTWHATSAEQVHRTCQRLGDARLMWLDD